MDQPLDIKVKQKNFEKKFYKIIEINCVDKMEKFLLTSDFKSFSDQYQQKVMNELVCFGYENEKMAKWSLTNNVVGVRGDIHENTDRPLRMACEFNPEFAKYLLTSPELTQKANINAINAGSSALLDSIRASNLDLVKYLITSDDLEVKARIDIADKEFDDPLCRACEQNCTEIVKYLLSDECYTNKEMFNAKINLSRFDYACVYKIIHNDNVDLLKFIIDNQLIDITKNKEFLDNMFCKAIIGDSRQVANYLESFFNEKVDITKLYYKNKKLLLAVASRCNYARVINHSYLHEMLEKMSHTISESEREQMKYWYLYNENSSTVKFLDVVDIYVQKNNVQTSTCVANKKIKAPVIKI